MSSGSPHGMRRAASTTNYKLQATSYKLQDTRYKIQDTRYSGRFAHPPACPGATMPRRRRLDQGLRAMAHSATRDEEGRGAEKEERGERRKGGGRRRRRRGRSRATGARRIRKKRTDRRTRHPPSLSVFALSALCTNLALCDLALMTTSNFKAQSASKFNGSNSNGSKLPLPSVTLYTPPNAFFRPGPPGPIRERA